MGDHSQVSIPDLLSISDKLRDKFFHSNDIYALLVLSLVTVTIYSREKRHITTQTRIDLAIAFCPDLIKHLKETNVISEDVATDLLKEYKRLQDELPLILQGYIYSAGGLRTKIDLKTQEPSKHRCNII
jgi:hypothetical protein